MKGCEKIWEVKAKNTHYQHCSGCLLDILGGLSIRYPEELPSYIRNPYDSNGCAFEVDHKP